LDQQSPPPKPEGFIPRNPKTPDEGLLVEGAPTPYKRNPRALRGADSGAYQCESLFVERCHKGSKWEDKAYCIFNMGDDDTTLPDGRVIYSFKKLYMDVGDPTEYRIGTEILANPSHWEKLKSLAFFQELLHECRDELTARIRSEAFKLIEHEAKSKFNSDAVRLSAQKFLASAGFENMMKQDTQAPSARKVGRPSKAEVEGALKRETEEEKALNEALKRVTQQAMGTNVN
jgi:hypothetical protein